MNTFKAAVATGLVSIALGASAQAGVLFSTGLGPNASGWLITGDNSFFGGPYGMAAEFTLSKPSLVTDIDFGGFALQSGDALGALYNANLGLPGASKPVHQEVGNVSGSCCTPQWLGLSGESWRLKAGTYWVSFIGSPGSSLGAEIVGSSPSSAQNYVGNAGGGWNANPGDHYMFQVLGSATPEPSTWAMMILGVGMLGGAIRRRSARAA